MVLFVFLAETAAQETSASGGDRDRGGFGAPVIKYTSINGQGAVMFGGRGGWIINHSLALGGGGYALSSEVDAPEGVQPWVGGPQNVDFVYGGFEIEYIFNPLSPAHFSISALAGGGATRYLKDDPASKGKDQMGETGFMWILEPGVNAELIVMRWLRLSAGMSYRLVTGLRQEGLKEV